MKPVHYFIAQKNRHHGEAIAKGWGAQIVPADSGQLVPGALHLIGGLQFGSLEKLKAVRERGERYVFFDRAYFVGGPGSNRLRCVPNAYQHCWTDKRPTDRMQSFGVMIDPWQPTSPDKWIMIVPPSDAIRKLFGIEDLWTRIEARAKACAMNMKRPYYVSFKGDKTPLAERLAKTHAVVTWTSNVAVEAICAGVPAFCHKESAAAPMANGLEDMEANIGNPKRPDGRIEWAAHLAYGQWSLDEIVQGFARQECET